MSNEFEARAQQDAELKEYLQRNSELSQRYRELGERTVPLRLDEQVLAQARQHLAGRKHRRSALWWGAPLALAASVFVTVSIVLQPGVQRAAAPQSVLVGPAPSSADTEQDMSAYSAPRTPDQVSEPVLSPSSPVTYAPAGAVSQEQVAPAAQLRSSVERADRSLPTASATAPTSAQPHQGDVQAEALRSAPPAAVREETRRLAAAKQAAIELRAKAAEPESNRFEDGQAETRESAGSVIPAPASAAPPALESAVSEPPLPPEGDLERDRRIAPAQWVKWIRLRQGQDKQQEAQQLLRRLRAAHPAFEVPADIALPAR